MISRYITVKAIITRDNEIIPVFDKKVKFVESDYFGDHIEIEGQYSKHFPLVDVIYDVKTRELTTGIELDYYPEKLGFEVGERVLYENKYTYRQLKFVTVKEIVYEKYELIINTGSKIEDYWKKYFSSVKFECNLMYSIKQWTPFYILDSGEKIEYDHQLYHFSE